MIEKTRTRHGHLVEVDADQHHVRIMYAGDEFVSYQIPEGSVVSEQKMQELLLEADNAVLAQFAKDTAKGRFAYLQRVPDDVSEAVLELPVDSWRQTLCESELSGEHRGLLKAALELALLGRDFGPVITDEGFGVITQRVNAVKLGDKLLGLFKRVCAGKVSLVLRAPVGGGLPLFEAVDLGD